MLEVVVLPPLKVTVAPVMAAPVALLVTVPLIAPVAATVPPMRMILATEGTPALFNRNSM